MAISMVQPKSNGAEVKSEGPASNGHANGNGVEAKKVEISNGSIPVVGFRYNEYDGKA